MIRLTLTAFALTLAVSGCSGSSSPSAVGARVGDSLDNASVVTGNAVGRAGVATGDALQRAGNSVTHAASP